MQILILKVFHIYYRLSFLQFNYIECMYLFIFVITLARGGSRALQNLTSHQRADVISKLAELLQEREKEILEENQKDLQAAEESGTVAPSLISRLALSSEKLKTLSSGLRQIASSSHNILSRTLNAMQIAEGMELRQVTVPIGVLMIIFESRPDALPQVR